MAAAEPLLLRLDEWTERHEAHVLLSRRLDLSVPAEEWSCILTWGGFQGKQVRGTGMTATIAVRDALDRAEVTQSAGDA